MSVQQSVQNAILKRFNPEPASPAVAFVFSEAGTIAEQTCPKDTGRCGTDVFSARRGLVAQICNLPYRRFVIGGASENSSALVLADAPQNAILRYSRLQICATLNTYAAGC